MAKPSAARRGAAAFGWPSGPQATGPAKQKAGPGAKAPGPAFGGALRPAAAPRGRKGFPTPLEVRRSHIRNGKS